MMFRVRTLVTGVAGAPWYSNIYFDAEGAYSPSTASANVQLAWNQWRSVMANDLTIQVQPDIAVVDPEDGEISGYEVQSQPALAGANSQDPLPFAVQGLIRIGTGAVRRGRRVQGRIFVPGLVGPQDADGTPPGYIVTALQAGADALSTGGSAAPPLTVWSRPLTVKPPVLDPFVLPGASCIATSVSARNFWAILRSRRD